MQSAEYPLFPLERSGICYLHLLPNLWKTVKINENFNLFRPSPLPISAGCGCIKRPLLANLHLVLHPVTQTKANLHLQARVWWGNLHEDSRFTQCKGWVSIWDVALRVADAQDLFLNYHKTWKAPGALCRAPLSFLVLKNNVRRHYLCKCSIHFYLSL